MKTKMIVLIIGIVIGVVFSFLYTVMFPKAVPIGENGYLVKGKYFVFGDSENGIRIFEKTFHGVSPKVFIPGRTHFRSLTTDIDPSVMDIKSGDLIQTKNISFNQNSFDTDLLFYRYDGEKLIKVPMVNTE